MLGNSEASPAAYQTKSIDEQGSDEMSCVRNVLYNTENGSLMVTGGRLQQSGSSLFRGSQDNVLVSGPSSTVLPPSRNASMRASCNNSSQVGVAMNNVLLSVNPADGTAVLVEEEPVTRATGKQRGEFNSLNGKSENFIAGKDHIQFFQKKIKNQMKEENIYGKGRGKDERVHLKGSHTVSEKVQYDIETLARLLDRPPAAEECQQQPYSVSGLRLGGNSISNSGGKYNIDQEFMAKRIRARVQREHRKQQDLRNMLIGMSSLETQLELQEQQEQEQEQEGAGKDGVNSHMDLSPRAREEATRVLGVPITAEVLGSPAEYGFHGRTTSDVPGTSPVLPRPSLVMQSSKTGGASEAQLSKLGVRTHPAYPRLRSSIFVANLIRGVYAVDVSKCPAQVADAQLLCLQAPVHTLAQHCDATAWQRQILEDKYRNAKKTKNQHFTSADQQDVSVFSLPTPSRSAQDPKEPYSPYLQSKVLSKEVPKKQLAHAPHLQHQELEGLTQTPMAWAAIVQAQAQMPRLRVLYIRQCNFNEAAQASLVAVLAQLNVAHVSLQGCGLGPSAGYAVERLIGMQAGRRDQVQWRMCLRNYKSYGVPVVPVEYSEERQVGERLQNLGLQSLDVSHNRLGDEVVARVIGCVAADQWLQSQDVSANGADEQSIVSLVETLALNTTLLHVKLEGTPEAALMVDSLDPVLPLRCANRLRWYSRPAYQGVSSDSNQLRECYNKYRSSMASLPDWLRYTDLAPEDKAALQDLPCPVSGANGGRLVAPVLDLVCDIVDCLHPLSHIRSNNAMRQGRVPADSVMGAVYREGMFVNTSNVQKMLQLDVPELSTPLPQHNVKKIVKGQPVVATKLSKDGKTVVDVPLLMHELEALVREERRVRHLEEMKEKDAATQNLWMNTGKKKKKVIIRKPNLTVVRKIHGIEEIGVASEDQALHSNAQALALASPYWSNVIDALDAVVSMRQKGEETASKNHKNPSKPRVGGGFVVPESTKAREHKKVRVQRKAPVPRQGSVRKEGIVNTHKVMPEPTYSRAHVQETLGLTDKQEQYLHSNNALKNPILSEALDEYLHTSKDEAAYANMYLRALSDTLQQHPKQLRDLKQQEQDDSHTHELMRHAQVRPLNAQNVRANPKQTGAFDVLRQLEKYVHSMDETSDTNDQSYVAPHIDDQIYSIEDVQAAEYQQIDNSFFPPQADKQYLEALHLLKQHEQNLLNE